MTSNRALYAQPRAVASIEDCYFYMAVDVPGVGPVPGEWDLRDVPDEYLGRVALAGRRVLEIGPANGFLTFFMEAQGADVVAVDLPPDAPWDFVPMAQLDMAREDRIEIMERVRNAFWYAHRAHGSKARMHYGDARDLPDELGRFDVSVLACVLLHARDPLGVLNSAARLTTDQIVITDVFELGMPDGPLAHLLPAPDNDYWHTWWSFSPAFFTNYLPTIGFSDVQVTRHARQHNGRPLELFTVVGTRTVALTTRPDHADEDGRSDERLAYPTPDAPRLAAVDENGMERFVPMPGDASLVAAEHMARYWLASHAVAGGRVLDAGCGDGYGSRFLASAGAEQVVGLDVVAPSPSGVPGVTFLGGDLVRLPFGDATFDRVVCFEAIEHVTDPDAVLDELCRVLQPGGVLILSTPNRDVDVPGNPHHAFEYTPTELIAALRKRFRSVRMLQQHPHVATLLGPVLDESGTAGELVIVPGAQVAQLAEVADAQYAIAIAGDGPLPAVPGIAVLGAPLELRWWHQELAGRDDDRRRVTSLLAERRYRSEQLRLLGDRLLGAEEQSATLLPMMEEIEQQRAALMQAHAEQDGLRAEVARVAAAWSQAVDEHGALHAEVARVAAAWQSAVETLAATEVERDELVARVAELETALQAITVTKTWRLSAFPRHVYGRLRRKRHA
jgi:2-polyprenyl-3-methyl-5-hydroxy-6-metoxy-1,4-benzoquinol methylase